MFHGFMVSLFHCFIVGRLGFHTFGNEMGYHRSMSAFPSNFMPVHIYEGAGPVEFAVRLFKQGRHFVFKQALDVVLEIVVLY
jgi:hypothetical protein